MGCTERFLHGDGRSLAAGVGAASPCGKFARVGWLASNDARVSSVTATVAERVRDRLRSEQSNPAEDPQRASDIARDEVRWHNDVAPARGWRVLDDEARAIREVLAVVSGFGPLQPYFDDPEIEEIWINSPSHIFVARNGTPTRLDLELTETEVRDIVERMLQATGRRVDLSQPFVDASLPDARVHVVIPDITRKHWSVNVRKFLSRYRTLDGLVETGSLPKDVARRLAKAMREGASVIVSGPTHAGKTTMLGALIDACPPEHRIITVEETFELAIDAPDVVAMQGRQPSLEGTGEVTLRRLVKESLRMRPDRIVVGEVRDAEALDLLLALNTGVPGACTVHANSADEALNKLAALTMLAGRNVERSFVMPMLAASVDLVIHCVRQADGSRRVAEILAPSGVDGERIVSKSLYRSAP
ncbi:CpaF family protein [Microbacterium mitrae]|uniref:CpaF family protein n=1 Tax=Microbacterium mitrae TaxID=664640 RepID=A0A5C8HRR3_9MICO|nr:CpaF family protein [Microbacterium mitrae]